MYLLQSDDFVRSHLLIAWGALALGVISGGMMGLFFHRPDWLGGYGSVPRRLIRLGHIAFFGMALLNFALAFTILSVNTAEPSVVLVASVALKIATITMPLICFASAINGINRLVFAVPVVGTFVLLVSVMVILKQANANDKAIPSVQFSFAQSADSYANQNVCIAKK